MTIENAAQLLGTDLAGSPWFTAVGIGEADGQPVLYLYVKTKRGIDLSRFNDGWQGFRVEIRKMGTPRFMVA